MGDIDDPTLRAAPELSRTVTGSQGTAVRTTEDGSIATDNYPFGGSFAYDGSTYPYTLDTANLTDPDILQAVTFTEAGDVDMEVTTTLGDTFTVRLAGTVGEWSNWEVESVTFKDPRGTAAPLYGSWSGE